jgi:uncharacterized protein (TIGR03067 family)
MKPQLLLAVFTALLLAADAKEDVQKELKLFQGSWRIESIEFNEQQVPADAFKDARLIFKGDTFSTKNGDQGTIKLAPDKKPKEIDITLTEGRGKGNTLLGIYEIDGDTYKLCAPSMPGKERPKEFTAKKGTGFGIQVLKRVKE